MLDDLLHALSSNNVAYQEKGRNTGREFINICCPFCGEDKFHMGIHRERGWYNCFVCLAHGGWYSIRKKLAAQYPSDLWFRIKPLGMTDYFRELEIPLASVAPIEPLCRELRDDEILFWKWLCDTPDELDDPYRERGFNMEKLRASDVKLGLDKFKGYFIWEQKGFLIGRKYHPTVHGPKWKIELIDGTTPIFGYEWARQSSFETTFITEGVFDCLRFPIGQAVAILGLHTSQEKIASVAEALHASDNVKLVLDRNVKESILDTWQLNLADRGFNVSAFNWDEIDDNIKDVDELSLCVDNFDTIFEIGQQDQYLI